MTPRNPSARKEPSRRNHDLNGSKDNPSALEILPSWSGRGQRSHNPALSPGPSNSSAELNPVDQTDLVLVVRCWTKKTLCEWLEISIRSWDRATAAGLTPAPDLMVGSSARWGAGNHHEVAANPAEAAREGEPVSTARKGRGRADASNRLIEALVDIAREIQPCSVRALAYQLFNRKLIPSMAKENTAKASRLSVLAREEGILPWAWIVDSTRTEQKLSTWDDPEEYAWTIQSAYRKNKWDGQPKHISVWSEKSTIEGTLRPVLDEYEVPFQVLHGWSGATPIRDAAQANENRDKSTLILYVGDFDPSGMGMSELDLPRRLARYSSDDPSDKDINKDDITRILDDVDLEIRRVALTREHTQLLGEATRFPASDKSSDSRHAWFVANHGQWCWELDALSPNQLRGSVKQAIISELDHEAWNRYVKVERAERKAIVDACKAWRGFLGQDQKYSSGRSGQ